MFTACLYLAEQLYPFGDAVGDAVVPSGISADVTSPPLTLSPRFRFFGRNEDTLYVTSTSVYSDVLSLTACCSRLPWVLCTLVMLYSKTAKEVTLFSFSESQKSRVPQPLWLHWRLVESQSFLEGLLQISVNASGPFKC